MTGLIKIKLFLILTVTIPLPVSAIEKQITIQWTIVDSLGISGYRLYYAYNKNMTDKKFACGTNQPHTTSLTCTNVNLSKSPVYFTIAAVTSTGEIPSAPVGKSFINSPNSILHFIVPQLLDDNNNKD